MFLSPLFHDHAGLQSDQPIPVWGEAAPGSALGVPIGITANAWGGTRIQSWHSREALIESDLCFLGGFPGPLRVLGIRIEEMNALPAFRKVQVQATPDNALGLSGGWEVRDICELIHAETAEVLATPDGAEWLFLMNFNDAPATIVIDPSTWQDFESPGTRNPAINLCAFGSRRCTTSLPSTNSPA